MTTQQLERPLSEVEQTAERIQASMTEPWDRYEEPPTRDMRAIRDRIRRVLRDPRAIAILSLVAAALVAAALLWARRTPPRSTEDLVLERSRETFERARAALEALAEKVTALER
jgi:hypothetical protein